MKLHPSVAEDYKNKGYFYISNIHEVLRKVEELIKTHPQALSLIISQKELLSDIAVDCSDIIELINRRYIIVSNGSIHIDSQMKQSLDSLNSILEDNISLWNVDGIEE